MKSYKRREQRHSGYHPFTNGGRKFSKVSIMEESKLFFRIGGRY